MSFDSWNKTFPYINLPYAFSSEKNSSSLPLLWTIWHSSLVCKCLCFTWELAAFQSPVTVQSFYMNYWSVLGIWRSKELESMVQMSDCNLKGFRRCRARSVVWLRQCPCQTQQKSHWGTKGCPSLDLWHAQHDFQLQHKKEWFRGWHKVPTLWGERGSDKLPGSVMFERS